MFRPIVLVPMFRLVPGYPLVLPRSRYVPECITRSVLCSGVVRPRYLGRERRLVVLIVWGLTLCRRRSRFVVVPCSNAYIVWGLTLCRRRSRRRFVPHLTGYEPWALPGLKSNDPPHPSLIAVWLRVTIPSAIPTTLSYHDDHSDCADHPR